MLTIVRLPALLLIFAFSFFAQEPASPAQAAPPAQTAPAPATAANQTAPPVAPALLAGLKDDHLISLDVVVTDKAGTPVSGLQQQDFTILDGKLPAPVVSFRATEEGKDAEPIQILFLIDAVNSGVQSVNIGRDQLEKFLRRNNGQLELPTSLVIFTDKGTQVQPFPTRDGNKLAEDLNSNPSGLRIINRSQGFYGATERLDLSLRNLEGLIAREMQQPGRKLLIWMSPGWPLLTGPGIQLTSKDQEWMFRSVVSFSKELRDARMTLYSIDPLGMSDAVSGRTFYWESFVKGVSSAGKVEGGNLALQVLAAQSGGRVLNSSNDLESLFAGCLLDAKAYYTLSFDAPPADHPNEYHNLEVRVDKPGLKVRTRNGYYAQPYQTQGR
jgi:VWFA-related protein